MANPTITDNDLARYTDTTFAIKHTAADVYFVRRGLSDFHPARARLFYGEEAAFAFMWENDMLESGDWDVAAIGVVSDEPDCIHAAMGGEIAPPHA